MPHLLFRAGFEIDAVSSNQLLKENKFLSDYKFYSDKQSMLVHLIKKNLDVYDFIIPCDDQTLKNILDSSLAVVEKLKLLPVQAAENLKHISSKIGLSCALLEGGVVTPDFVVAGNFTEAVAAGEKLGYPLMLKIDFSGGGNGVFKCESASDLASIPQENFNLPLLVQKKISGEELDLSGIYRSGKLVTFSYSTIKKVIGNEFGPSSVRVYEQLGNVSEDVFLEMKKLGKVLGANGFVTISAIKSSGGKIYFIEADMRPNVWVEMAKFIGDDPAKKLQKWFLQERSQVAKLQYPQPLNKKFPTKLLIPYFARLSVAEILTNRYNVWKFMLKEDREFVLRFLYQQIFFKVFRTIKRSPTLLIRVIVPRKENRVKVRNFLLFKP